VSRVRKLLVFEEVSRFISEFRRVKNASAELRRAYALYGQERFAETAEVLKRVRETSARPGNNPFLFGAQSARECPGVVDGAGPPATSGPTPTVWRDRYGRTRRESSAGRITRG
ncbi:hypothetical protein, partial [Anaeromyxobacter sp. PSR-1]|uniref:hypothetical protein n=1 Tax=Anaeromyxobacter sp. PSR-1 TaxID=1300915 RepID=UPI001ED99FF5